MRFFLLSMAALCMALAPLTARAAGEAPFAVDFDIPTSAGFGTALDLSAEATGNFYVGTIAASVAASALALQTPPVYHVRWQGCVSTNASASVFEIYMSIDEAQTAYAKIGGFSCASSTYGATTLNIWLGKSVKLKRISGAGTAGTISLGY